MRTLLIGAAALAVGRRAGAQTRVKLARAEAEYQDLPKDIRMCAICSRFEPPHSCKVVDGEVSPNGWCKLFQLAD
jgi:hypothetical protein